MSMSIARSVVARHRETAFTLVELIVVISILGVLAAILLPVFAHVRAKSRQTACLSNLRQIGVATLMYAEDNDNRFPFGGDAADIYGGDMHSIPGGNLVIAIQPLPNMMSGYVKDKRIWSCPSDTGYVSTGLGGPGFAFDTRPSVYERYGNSYAYYTQLAIGQYPVSNIRATSRYSLLPDRGPADIVVFSDGTGAWHGGTTTQLGRYSSLFVDGHVKDLDSADYADAYDITLSH